MAPRQENSATGTDLVRRVGTSLTVSEAVTRNRMGNLTHRFEKAVENARSDNKGLSAMFYGCTGLAVAGYNAFDVLVTATVVGPVSPAIGGILGAVALGAGIIGTVAASVAGFTLSHNVAFTRGGTNHSICNAYSDLREIYEEGQKLNMRERQDQLVALADEELAQGVLLDGQAMAALAAVPLKCLEQASDTLAISVMQVRGMLAYQRCRDRQASGEKDIQKPLTFKQLRLNPADELHGNILRERLVRQAESAGWGLDEDREARSYEELALPSVPALEEPGFWGKLGRVLAAPLYRRRDLAEIAKLELPALPDIPVHPLPLAADFDKALAHYERTIEKLDLPALRARPSGQRPASLPPVLKR